MINCIFFCFKGGISSMEVLSAKRGRSDAADGGTKENN